MIPMLVDTAIEVVVNVLPLTDDGDFKSIEEAIAYDESGMDLNWNFQQPDGTVSQTNVTPTSGGDYDWAHVGNGMYKIEIPADSGASINNDTEGVGWFTGVCDGVLPWAGPRYLFAKANVINSLVTGSDTLEVDVTQLLGSAVQAANGYIGIDWAQVSNPTATIDFTQTTIGVVTTNTDMRGTDGANTTVPDAAGTAAGLHATTDAKIDAVQGDVTTIAADVANIDGDAMRGTDGANTTVPDAAGTAATLISNLETHGDGAWATATGFSTHGDPTAAIEAYGDLNWATATGFSTHGASDVVTTMEADGSKLDHLWETTEDDGGTRRFTENALEEAPGGATVDQLLAGIIDGTISLKVVLERLNALAQGKIVKSGGTYSYKKEDGTTDSFENVIAAGGRNL
ncbi:MAG TPA: hypothetical protein VMW52_01990 [Phycisphaerae bacterium]|nr:hypothetical protein [Phycisphaerae bacterium]